MYPQPENLCMMNRRNWLRTAGLAGLAGAACRGPLPLPAAPLGSPSPSRGPLGLPKARNIIFFAYDGTGFEDLATAEYFSTKILGRPLLFRQVMAWGASGSMLTHSLASVVTDSAAASSAWSTGRKVVNGALSMYPDGRRLTTVLELARGAGKATGLVTTTRMTHATPAGWIARVLNRDLEDEIAEQYLAFEPEVLLGGGAGHFLAQSRGDGRDLTGAFQAKGYQLVGTRDDLLSSNGSRLLGLFAPGTRHLPYEIDRRFQDAPSPSLAEAARKGLEVLDGAQNGFLLQVEAGRIDHANHDNDPGGMVWDWMAADEALAVVVDFVDRTPETLLIVAADHDTGGGTVYGYGSGYQGSTPAFRTLDRQRISLEGFNALMGRDPSLSQIRDGSLEHLGFEPTPAQTEQLQRVFRREVRFGHPTSHLGILNSIHAVLSEIPSGGPDRPNITFSTGRHTAGVVPVALYGAGVPRTSLGVVDNTEPFGWMTEALGTTFRNPDMTEEEAWEILSAPGVEGEPSFRHPQDD
jgi:alkaline phosphatase